MYSLSFSKTSIKRNFYLANKICIPQRFVRFNCTSYRSFIGRDARDRKRFMATVISHKCVTVPASCGGTDRTKTVLVARQQIINLLSTSSHLTSTPNRAIYTPGVMVTRGEGLVPCALSKPEYQPKGIGHRNEIKRMY